jgi:hypothetical protein
MPSLHVFIILAFLPLALKAEYRVFTLHIINPETHITRQVETTLDPDQFKSVYPLQKPETISYVETWRCLGRTDFFKTYCDNPHLQPVSEALPDRGPASVPSQSPEFKK